MPLIHVSIDTQVLDGILSRLPGFDDFINEAAAEIVFEESQRRVKVDTGELKESGGILFTQDGWKVFYDANHASFVEYGTRYMAAQPYLFPSVEAVNWRSIINAAFRMVGFN
jgi:hypothetical protein